MPTKRPAGWWTTIRDWAGASLPAEMQARLARADARLQVLLEQIAALDEAQQAAVAAAPADSARQRLVQLRGVATTSAAVLIEEGLLWREFQNRRQVGGALGFAPTPYASGTLQRELGIRRAGNTRLQSTMIQLAWNWVRWQPLSPITQWYQAHFGPGKRSRKIGIVAVARKLLVALWRWAAQGILPADALLTPA